MSTDRKRNTAAATVNKSTVNTVAEHGGPTVLEEHSDSKTKVHGVRYSGRTKRTRDSVFRTVFRVSLISPVLSTRWDETLPPSLARGAWFCCDGGSDGQMRPPGLLNFFRVF